MPQTAVVVRDGFSYVYRVGTDSKVSQLKVQTGRQSGDAVEVLSGLNEGDQIIISGTDMFNGAQQIQLNQ